MLRRRKKWITLGVAAKHLGMGYRSLYDQVRAGNSGFSVYKRIASDGRLFRFLDYAEVMEAVHGTVD